MNSQRRPMPMQEMPALFSPGESLEERKASVQRRHDEYQAERQKQLDAQASPFNTAEERIRIWEQLHALRLPLQPQHRLVRVIAVQTELSVSAVHAEQARRAGTTPAE